MNGRTRSPSPPAMTMDQRRPEFLACPAIPSPPSRSIRTASSALRFIPIFRQITLLIRKARTPDATVFLITRSQERMSLTGSTSSGRRSPADHASDNRDSRCRRGGWPPASAFARPNRPANPASAPGWPRSSCRPGPCRRSSKQAVSVSSVPPSGSSSVGSPHDRTGPQRRIIRADRKDRHPTPGTPLIGTHLRSLHVHSTLYDHRIHDLSAHQTPQGGKPVRLHPACPLPELPGLHQPSPAGRVHVLPHSRAGAR